MSSEEITNSSSEGLVRTPEKVAAAKRLARFSDNAEELLRKRVKRKPSKDSIVPLLIGLIGIALFLRYMTNHDETSAIGTE